MDAKQIQLDWFQPYSDPHEIQHNQYSPGSNQSHTQSTHAALNLKTHKLALSVEAL